MGEQHANQNHIHEEPLDATFGDSEIHVRQITPDDAGIVCAVPIARCGPPDEVEVCSHARAAGLTAMAEGERSGFGRVAQQPFVQRPPPWAAGPGVALRVQKPPPQLPAHERRCRPPVRKVSAIHTSWNFIKSAQQRQPRQRVVPDPLYG